MADLVIKTFTGAEVGRVKVNSTNEAHVEKVMRGLLINLREDCFVDGSEVDAARERGE